MTAFKNILTLVALLLLRCIATAQPVVHWQLEKYDNSLGWQVVSNADNLRCVQYDVYYRVRAVATETNGTLYSISVYKNNLAWALDAASGQSSISSPNVSYSGVANGGPHIDVYTAYATDTLGRQSPLIMWAVKTLAFTSLNDFGIPVNGGGQVTEPLLTFAMLPTKTGAPSGAQWAVMPPAGISDPSGSPYPGFGSARYNSLFIQDLAVSTQGSTPRTLWFCQGLYNFELNCDGGTAGQLLPFRNLQNFWFSGETPSASTTLRWFATNWNTATGGVNINSPATSAHPYAVAQSFMSFSGDCDYIKIMNLTFDTPYKVDDYGLVGLNSPGSHVKYTGNDLIIDTCQFFHAPGFAVSVYPYAGTSNNNPNTGYQPSHITIEACNVWNTWADGIHIDGSTDVWIVGNDIENTGDDAIALLGTTPLDGVASPTQTKGFHILSNTIKYSGWRGIVIAAGTGSDTTHAEIKENVISYTADKGIEIAAREQFFNGGAATFDPSAQNLSDVPNHIDVTDNLLDHIGSMGGSSGHVYLDPITGQSLKDTAGVVAVGAHQGRTLSASGVNNAESGEGIGMKIEGCVNMWARPNTINTTTSYACDVEGSWYIFVGNLNNFTNYGNTTTSPGHGCIAQEPSNLASTINFAAW